MLGTNNLDIRFPWQGEDTPRSPSQFQTRQDDREEHRGILSGCREDDDLCTLSALSQDARA